MRLMLFQEVLVIIPQVSLECFGCRCGDRIYFRKVRRRFSFPLDTIASTCDLLPHHKVPVSQAAAGSLRKYARPTSSVGIGKP